MVSEYTQMSFMLILPVLCGVNKSVFRVFLHLWRRKSVGQGGVLQSQVFCHIFTIGIANNFPYGRVIEGGGNHVSNEKIQYARVYSELMQDWM